MTARTAARLGAVALATLIACCRSRAGAADADARRAETVSPGSARMSKLADRLTQQGYERLFLSLDDSAVDSIWREKDAPRQLEALATDAAAPTEARFLAAEVLFRKRPGYPPDDARAALAPVYAEALRTAQLGNPWGLPGEVGDQTGAHLVRLGRPAVDALLPLLDDERRVSYGGSKEATLGNSYGYRVKDLAAFYISRIGGIPYEVREDPSARDSEIERMRELLSRQYSPRA